MGGGQGQEGAGEDRLWRLMRVDRGHKGKSEKQSCLQLTVIR